MIIKYGEFPPNYIIIRKEFNPPETTVYTYGDTIYAPFIHGVLSQDLIAHEEVHEKQQNGDPMGWWKHYIDDKNFRLHEEVQAYRAQYKVFRKRRDRNKIALFVHALARDLSGPMYGHIIDLQEAIRLIRS